MHRRFFLAAVLVVLLAACGQNASQQPGEHVYMPTYANSSVFKRIAAPDGKSEEVYLHSTDDAKRIIDFYMETLKSSGWDVSANSGFGLITMITAEKGSHVMGVRVIEQNGKRLIHQNLKQRKRFRWW